jgi:large subunit ribosomal protein L37Ae
MGKTLKVKSTGRFGARYGVGIRKRLLKVESKKKKRYVCPECEYKRVKRLASGLFKCSKCGIKFAGGAFFPKTMSGSIVQRMVSQKSFVSAMSELISASEEEKVKTVEKESVKEKNKGVKKHGSGGKS